jgi:hypothetical protein
MNEYAQRRRPAPAAEPRSIRRRPSPEPTPEVVVRRAPDLGDPEMVKGYALPLKDLLPAIPAGERLAALGKAVNTALQAAGVPAVELEDTRFKGFGELQPRTWSIGIPDELLASSDARRLAEVVGTVYHEARHAEQYFLAAQWHAKNGDEGKLLELDLRPDVRMAAQEAAPAFNPSSSLQKDIVGWDESIRGARKVFDPLEEAEKALSFQADTFMKAVQVLVAAAAGVPGALQSKDLSALDLAPIEDALKGYDKEKRRLELWQGDVEDGMKRYRGLAHEKDAHRLGWRVEDTFLTGTVPTEHDPAVQLRFPDTDPAWTALAEVEAAVGDLRDLVAEVVEARREVDSDELEVVETPEQSAARSVKYFTEETSGPEYDRHYQELLKHFREKVPVVETPPLTAEAVEKRITAINVALAQWNAVEGEYLALVSARLHRRTVV